MTQEDKKLLLADLCARLPYGVKCYSVTTKGEPNTIGGYCEIFDDFYIREVSGWFNISMIKPYLRPMSSMTEEEHKEFAKVIVRSQDCSYQNNESATTMVNDWYLSKGFDVRGLIPKGLALEALEGMYEY